jgi:hypothetical protein
MFLPLPLFVPLLSLFVFFIPLKMAMLADIFALKAQLKNVKIYQDRVGPMFRCVRSNFIICIDPIEIRKGLFSREQYNVKTLFGSAKCLVVCLKGKRVAHPHHATCLVDCLEMFI